MTPQELKNSILQLAVQGKLVEQRPDEGTAEELYQQIQEEKQRLIKEGKIKKEKPLPEITEDEIPFDIPESWKWVYIGDLFQHNTGKALNSSNKEGTPYTYITTSNVYWNRFELDNLKTMLYTEAELEKCSIAKGDLLVLEGGDVGRAAIWNYDTPMRIQNHIHRLRSYSDLYIEFYYYIFMLYKGLGQINGKGIGIKGLSANALHRLIVSLPPLAEQKRIVAKIEELLPYIDRYEKAWGKLEDFNKRFPSDMQKSVLQMAIQGKLVEQRPEEGTGEELYRQIKAEKQSLIKSGKIKKEKPLPEITEDEVPFDIPESWKWVRWGTIAKSIQYGYNAPALLSGTIKMVRISDIQNGQVVWDSVPYCEIQDEEISTYLLEPNDILFARTGGTVGKSYLVSTVPEKAIYAGYLIRTQYSKSLCPKYLKFFMGSALYWSQLRSGTIATAQPNCNGKTLSKMILPLPPLAEQKRIVEKLEEILPLCEKLKRTGVS